MYPVVLILQVGYTDYGTKFLDMCGFQCGKLQLVWIDIDFGQASIYCISLKRKKYMFVLAVNTYKSSVFCIYFFLFCYD